MDVGSLLRLGRQIKVADGAEIPYRGDTAKLHYIKEKVRGVSVEYRDGFHITVPETLKDPSTSVRWQLRAWFMGKLQSDCNDLVEQYMRKTGVDIKYLNIKEKDHGWSSHTSRRNVNVNWSLIFAPLTILEYVIAREICLIKSEADLLLDSLLPEWKKSETWLKKNKKIRKTEL